MTTRVLALALIALASAGPLGAARADSTVVILTTTTSTQDSGLLDVLLPMFERTSGYTVKTIAVGTGQALALAARGEADVALAHAPSLEKRYVVEGKLLNRRLVMYNDFLVIGPRDDPARITGMTNAVEAFRRIAAARARFFSRGDKSGTHILELELWQRAGVTPAARWYVESGQGMGATLALADDRHGYTLTDRATYLALRKRLALSIAVAGDRELRNVYSVLEVNGANGPRVNVKGGKAFADFILAPETQRVIG